MSTPTIVVGVDGSPSSDHALSWARAEAARRDADVRAVLTWEVPAFMVSPSVLSVTTSPASIVEDAARETLEEVGRAAQKGAGPLITVLRHGPVVAEVLAEVADHEAEMVVVGTRGLGAVGRVLLGSVSARLAREAPCPVAIVPETAPIAADGPAVVGVDGSAGSIAALRWAAGTGRPIVAVHAIEYPFGPDYAVEGLTFSDHESFGRDVVEGSLAKAVDDTAEVDIDIVVSKGDAREVLAEAAADAGAAVVVVGARAQGIAGLGSVANSAASHSPVAVVVVPPPAD